MKKLANKGCPREMSPKIIEEIKKEYYAEVSKLSDDTGYFDHEFVLNFFLPKLTKAQEEAVRGFAKMLKNRKILFSERNGLLKGEKLNNLIDGYAKEYLHSLDKGEE